MYAAPASSKAQPGRSHMLDAAIAFAIRVGSAGLVFLLQVFLARMMDLGDYGSYVTAWTWLVMLGAFAPLGIAESAVRFLPRYRARGRHGSARAFFRFGLRTVLLASLLIAGIAVILAMAGDWLDNRVGLMILMIAAGLPFLATQNFLEGVARAHGWYRLTSVPIYLLRPLIIIGGCAAFYATGAALDLPTVSLVVVAAMALVCIGLLVAVSRAMSREPQADSPDAITGSRRVWFKASVPLMLVSGVEDLLIYSDVLVLGILLDPDQVSIYFAAARALALANFVYYAFYFVSARGFSISNALADREKLQEAVWATTRATFWFTALAVAATLVAGPWLLAAFWQKLCGRLHVHVDTGGGPHTARRCRTIRRAADHHRTPARHPHRFGYGTGNQRLPVVPSGAPLWHRGGSCCHRPCHGRARHHVVPGGSQLAQSLGYIVRIAVVALYSRRLIYPTISATFIARAGPRLADYERGLNSLYQRGTTRHALENLQSRQVGRDCRPFARSPHQCGLGVRPGQPAGLGAQAGRVRSGHLAVNLANAFGEPVQLIATVDRADA
jgi:hypothetical protein